MPVEKNPAICICIISIYCNHIILISSHTSTHAHTHMHTHTHTHTHSHTHTHIYAALLEESRTVHYETKTRLIQQGQSQAKRRITYFLNVFVITGLFSELAILINASGPCSHGKGVRTCLPSFTPLSDFVLSTLFVYHEILKLKEERHHVRHRHLNLHFATIVLLFLQVRGEQVYM